MRLAASAFVLLLGCASGGGHAAYGGPQAQCYHLGHPDGGEQVMRLDADEAVLWLEQGWMLSPLEDTSCED